MSSVRKSGIGWLIALGCAAVAQAGGIAGHSMRSARPLASNLVVPQRSVFSGEARQPVQITEVAADVVIAERVATTRLDIALMNPTDARQEAELLVPVPEGVAVRGFTFQGAAAEATAEVLARDDARRIYQSIVSKMRDPALLEFVGSCLVRSSVFPVEARDKQAVRLTYEGLVTADGSRVDYVLPRTESVYYTIPWNVKVRIKSKAPISTVYSPSHKLEMKRLSPTEVEVEIAEESRTAPGALRLSYLVEEAGLSATLFAYPDPKVKGGYFLLLAGLPARRDEGAPAIKREVTLVLDRSGSMNGEKIEQVREAAFQVLAGLDEGEAFNIIAYNDQVSQFADRPVAKTKESVAKAREYLEGVNARGGTNIHDALIEALRPKPAAGFLPMVLFLTDGLPTVGQTAEVAIRDAARKANVHSRRVFTFGVGADVNTALLERVALETRATSTFVLPKENVEVKVSSVFKRLAGPVLADTKLEVVGPDNVSAPGRVLDVIPGRLPDLFEGEQLVVLGQYVGDQPITFSVSGNYLGKKQAFPFAFDLGKATTRNAFVPRLWASRKIAVLLDGIRELGADIGPTRIQQKARNAKTQMILDAIAEVTGQSVAAQEAKLKELVGEVVRLSAEFGILTEYTAFLAREGTDLTRCDALNQQAQANLEQRAMNTRVGIGSINQDFNRQEQRGQTILNYRNDYYDATMNRVETAAVQQVNDRAFFHRGRQWIDSQAAADAAKGLRPDRTVAFGSPEYWQLVEQLVREDRQGVASLPGELLIRIGGQNVLITAAK
ncbi:MAG: VWA domain-containing protein [Planctomycetes bacterium]|nr:VWA domain-containing protein [Planctomycetota bacterium]